MPHMHLPFVYEAEIIAPGRRKPEKHRVREMAAFPVREVTADEAPVSLVMDFDEAVPGGQGRRAVRRATFRVHGGRTYMRVDRSADAPTAVADYEAAHATHRWVGAVEAPAVRAAAVAYPGQAGIDLRGFSAAGTIHSVRDMQAILAELTEEACGRGRVRVRSDDRQVRRSEAGALFPATLLVVDGEVWSAQGAGEPRYHVAYRGRGVANTAEGVRVEVVQGIDPTLDGYRGQVFRIDRREDALAHARDLARSMSDCQVTVTGSHAVDVFPPLLTLDEAVETATQLLGARKLDYLDSSMPFEAVAAMVAAAKVPAGERDGAWAAAVVHACRSLERYWSGAVPRHASPWSPGLARWDADALGDRLDVAAAMRALKGEAEEEFASFAP